MDSMILISSFSPISTMYSGILGDIETGMLMNFDSPQGYENQLIQGFADALHPEAGSTTAELVQSAHDVGMKVNVWTVNDPVEMLGFYQMGCEGVITNHPDLCIDALKDFATQ